MSASPQVKIQYYVDSMRAQAVDIENILITNNLSSEKSNIYEAKLEMLNDMIESFERLFYDVLFNVEVLDE